MKGVQEQTNERVPESVKIRNVMKVRCDGTSSSGGIEGSCMMKTTTKNQGQVSKDHESSR